jgi:hypothetical protein
MEIMSAPVKIYSLLALAARAGVKLFRFDRDKSGPLEWVRKCGESRYFDFAQR